MFECVAISGGGEASGCAFNPFRTAYPYIFIAISLALACAPPQPRMPFTRAPPLMPFTRAHSHTRHALAASLGRSGRCGAHTCSLLMWRHSLLL